MRHTRIDSDIRRILKALVLSCILYGSLLFVIFLLPFPVFLETRKPPTLSSIPRSLSVHLALVSPNKKSNISTAGIKKEIKVVQNPSIEISPRSFEEVPSSLSVGTVQAIESGFNPTISAHDAFVSWLDSEITHKRVYPERARRRNIEGTVTLLLTVSSDGLRCIPFVTESSGSALLDKAAITLILSLFPAPISPGKEFADSIKIQYLLEQD